MPAGTVRISGSSREALRRLAREEGRSMQAVLDHAIERYRRERFLIGANADFAALRKNSKAWKEEQAERELWEQTLGDHLEDE
jgi:predicted kinase